MQPRRNDQHPPPLGFSSMGSHYNTPPPPPPLFHFTLHLPSTHLPPLLFQTCFLQLGGCGSGGSIVSWVNVTLSAVHPMYVDVLDDTYQWLNWPRPKSVVVGRSQIFCPKVSNWQQTVMMDMLHYICKTENESQTLGHNVDTGAEGHNSVSGRMQQWSCCLVPASIRRLKMINENYHSKWIKIDLKYISVSPASSITSHEAVKDQNIYRREWQTFHADIHGLQMMNPLHRDFPTVRQLY